MQNKEYIHATRSIGELIQALLGPYSKQVHFEDDLLIFGGRSASKSSKIAGSVFLLLAIVLYLLVLLLFDGWIVRILMSMLATMLMYIGLFFIRYYHAVILNQKTKSIILESNKKQQAFASFEDVIHFKDTEHRQRGKYRATTLSIVLKDKRELRLLTYKKDLVQESFPTSMNRLLWAWLNGHKELGEVQK